MRHAGATPTIQRIEERISRLTMTAVGQGEGLQILRYEVQMLLSEWVAVFAPKPVAGHLCCGCPNPTWQTCCALQPGEKYDPHHDYFSHEEADAMGGNRLVTGLMYLSDVEEGGETVFPKVSRCL
eukprot:353404-Chlamydomonas_euryale.AAC.18